MCPILPIFPPKKAPNKIDFLKKIAGCQKMIIFFQNNEQSKFLHDQLDQLDQVPFLKLVKFVKLVKAFFK